MERFTERQKDIITAIALLKKEDDEDPDVALHKARFSFELLRAQFDIFLSHDEEGENEESRQD